MRTILKRPVFFLMQIIAEFGIQAVLEIFFNIPASIFVGYIRVDKQFPIHILPVTIFGQCTCEVRVWELA